MSYHHPLCLQSPQLTVDVTLVTGTCMMSHGLVRSVAMLVYRGAPLCRVVSLLAVSQSLVF